MRAPSVALCEKATEASAAGNNNQTAAGPLRSFCNRSRRGSPQTIASAGASIPRLLWRRVRPAEENGGHGVHGQGRVNAANGALVGASDHGTTKSLYAKDPDGLEFEVAWIVPADRIDDSAIEGRKRIGRLDLARELARYGADTRGGVGISH